jgi:quercetin dioxygenase-like cupin family protein
MGAVRNQTARTCFESRWSCTFSGRKKLYFSQSQRRKVCSAERSPASLPRAGAFQNHLVRRCRLETVPGVPTSVRLAVIVGQPSEPGPYTIRVKAPRGAKLKPHKHREDRVYTVISGVFYIGLGDEFDASKLEAYPPGAVIILPGNTAHFHWARSGEYVTQITAMGPLGLEYLSAKDDPRNNSS